MRILGGRRIVLVMVATLVMPATSAIATDGTDHRSLEERLVESDFFVSGIDGANLIGIRSCGSGTTVASRRYPEKYPATAYRTCAGEVKTPDGIELDTRVSFPCRPASPSACDASGLGSDPLPMVVLLHSWAGNRNAVQGTYGPIDSQAYLHPGNDPDNGLTPARFLAKGYATLVYTARGYQASCGPVDMAGDLNGVGGPDNPSAEEKACLLGHTHLAERAFEIADTQRLLARLVDLKVADPNRLAATGGSYGGGQSWLLATAMPWDTPAPGTHMIQLAAAAPFAGWTDLYGSLAPNGRATDGVDQSRSHEQPFGVVKEQTFNATYGRRAPQPHIPTISPSLVPGYPLTVLASGIRYNTTNPLELHSFIDGWAAVFNAGEPHTSQQAVDLPPAFRGKSAYHSVADPKNDYLTQLAARRVRPVPIFAVQGWTDHFFPAVEALQMYRKLKAAHPGYPINMLIGDIGHGAQDPPEQLNHSWDQASAFIDSHLGLATDVVVPAATSFAMLCGGTDPHVALTHVALTSDNWDALVQRAPRKFSSASSDEPRHTDSSSSNVEEEMASDPSSAGGGSCIKRPQDASASKALWRWDVGSDFTMLGLPRVTLPYKMEGQDATVIAKLWDVDPKAGKKVLVTRGVYRVSPPLGQTASSGLIDFQLFGNHWSFAKGHQIELEIGQRDMRFLRPDNFPSSIDYHNGVELSIPQAKAS